MKRQQQKSSAEILRDFEVYVPWLARRYLNLKFDVINWLLKEVYGPKFI